MSLVFNEAALKRLLEDEDGPIGIELDRIAQNVATIYNANVARYLPAFVEQGGEVGHAVVSGENGLEAVIGIRAGHGSDRFAENVAKKVLKEPDKATDALDVGLHQ